MKAGLQKSVRDAQIRDSYNKESFAIIKDDGTTEVAMQLNTLERVLPRNTTGLHTVLVTGSVNSETKIFIVNYEVLEFAKAGFRNTSDKSDGVSSLIENLSFEVNDTKQVEEVITEEKEEK